MTALRNDTKSWAKHRLLKQGSLTQRVFLEVRARPDQRAIDIANMLKEDRDSVRGAVQRLVGEGLLVPVDKQVGQRVVTAYQARTDNETGMGRDKVKVEVIVYVNDYGEYSATAKVVNQMPTAPEDNPQRIKRTYFDVVVPRPTESVKVRAAASGDVIDAVQEPALISEIK